MTEGTASAERVLVKAANAYREALGDRLVASYALGSLAHGGFSPLVSDIDLGLIVADPVRADDAATIQAVADTETSSALELSERLSVFWGTPSTLHEGVGGARFPPIDRLDLLENGRLLTGTDARAELSRPSAAEVFIDGVHFALRRLAGVQGGGYPPGGRLSSRSPAGEDAVEEILSPELLLGQGARRLTKLVLFPVRFLFTAATGRLAANSEAVAHYLGVGEAPSTTLVRAALAWRTTPPADEQAATELLRDEMVPLYLHYMEDHIARLELLNRLELAHAFEDWRKRLIR